MTVRWKGMTEQPPNDNGSVADDVKITITKASGLEVTVSA